MTAAERLHERLVQVMAMEKAEPFTKESAREAIRREQLDVCMCARVPSMNNRPATFSQFFAVVFGETIDGKPWKPKKAAS